MNLPPPRGPALPWSDSFNIGIATLDADHRALVDLINRLCDHCRADRRDDALTTLEEIISLAEAHFAREEAVLRDLQCDNNLDSHAGEHRQRVKQLSVLQQRFLAAVDTAVQMPLCEAVIDWFVRQSIGHDAQIRAYIDNHGTRFVPPSGRAR